MKKQAGVLDCFSVSLLYYRGGFHRNTHFFQIVILPLFIHENEGAMHIFNSSTSVYLSIVNIHSITVKIFNV